MRGVLLTLLIVLAAAPRAKADGLLARPMGDPATKTGAELYRSRCGGCHALDRNKYGPSHRDLFGRPAATQPDYAYSEALKRSGIVWNAATLDQWLSDPRRMAPGTRMSQSVKDPEQRRQIIDYLKSRP